MRCVKHHDHRHRHHGTSPSPVMMPKTKPKQSHAPQQQRHHRKTAHAHHRPTPAIDIIGNDNEPFNSLAHHQQKRRIPPQWHEQQRQQATGHNPKCRQRHRQQIGKHAIQRHNMKVIRYKGRCHQAGNHTGECHRLHIAQPRHTAIPRQFFIVP